MEFTNDQLERASEIWLEAQGQEPEALLYAMQVLRSWRVGVKSELRRLQRSSEKYREVKELEEGLEAKVLDLRDALMVKMNARRSGG